MPSGITYTLSELKDFIGNDNDVTIAFYGGEPLLNYDIVREFVNNLPAKHFVINTNGTYIESLKDIIHRFDSILLSVDGRKHITDFYRGIGCYDNVHHAVDFLNKLDFRGEIIARMSVSHCSDIYIRKLVIY
jgi:sulfatase maturation enzyme AslB (radical SAM superfamily)